jgi:MtN3 and saliva related transmembrane protein
MDWATIIGSLAALASMTSFTPQAWKIIKSKHTSDISAATYSLTVGGFALWISYGVLLGQWPIIVANAVCLALSGFILAMTILPPRQKREVAKRLDPDAKS